MLFLQILLALIVLGNVRDDLAQIGKVWGLEFYLSAAISRTEKTLKTLRMKIFRLILAVGSSSVLNGDHVTLLSYAMIRLLVLDKKTETWRSLERVWVFLFNE